MKDVVQWILAHFNDMNVKKSEIVRKYTLLKNFCFRVIFLGRKFSLSHFLYLNQCCPNFLIFTFKNTLLKLVQFLENLKINNICVVKTFS
jgi:hypothetical protein